MVGIVFYIYFLVLGFLYADMLFKDRDIFTKAWLGGITGNLLLMAGIVPFAFIFKFGVLSHVLLIIAAAAPYVVVSFKKKEVCIIRSGKLSLNTDIKNGAMGMRVFLCLVLPIALIICSLLVSHVLYAKNGGYYTGQCTYGDLQMHMDIVSSMSNQHSFPPEYNILHGQKLCYPFFIDMLSASLCVMGTPLKFALLIPSFVFAFLIVMGFYFLAHSLTGKKSIAVLATVFFFLNGAFGFAYFFEGAKADPTAFTKIFTEYYQTPTNLNEKNIRWANTICDMIIPQRTTMAGWTYVLCALWLLREALAEKRTRIFVYLGVLAGCMPMIHTHSFMALGLISAVAAVYEIAMSKDKKSEVRLWLFYGVIAAVLALPQLLIWTFSQAAGEGFVTLHAGWVNENDPSVWFWIKNWGLVFLFAIPAFFNTSRINKLLMAGALPVFITANFIQFQPLSYDNNKLFFVAYMIYIITVTQFFALVYEKLKDVKLRQYAAALVIVCCTLSGALTIVREFKSGGAYQLYSKNDLEFAEFVKNNTDTDGLFMTGTYHINPVTAIAGRSVYVGAGLFLNFHGFSKEFNRRSAEAEKFYNAGVESDIQKMIDEKGLSYVVVGPQETGTYTVKKPLFEKYKKLYDKGGYALYDVR